MIYKKDTEGSTRQAAQETACWGLCPTKGKYNNTMTVMTRLRFEKNKLDIEQKIALRKFGSWPRKRGTDILQWFVHLYDTSAARVQYTDATSMLHLVQKPGSQHWGLCILHESENYIYNSPISGTDAKQPLRVTSSGELTIPRAGIERVVWVIFWKRLTIL